jgi:hypothetical protein
MDKFAELFDKNIDRLVEKLGSVGPDATWLAKEMVERYAFGGWIQLVMGAVVFAASIFACYGILKIDDKYDFKYPLFLFPATAMALSSAAFCGGLTRVLYPEAGLLALYMQ